MKRRIIILNLTLLLGMFILGMQRGILDFNKGVFWFIIFLSLGIINISYIILELKDIYFQKRNWTPLHLLLSRRLDEYPFLKKIYGLLGLLIILQLPLFLLTVDSKLKVYLPHHFAITLVLFGSLVITKCIPVSKTTSFFPKRFINAVAFFYPFFIIAVYPFVNILYGFVLLLFVTGIIIPFISLKVTWWLYTFGGMMPLKTKDNEWGSQWLEKYRNKNSIGINTGLSKWLFRILILLALITTLLFHKFVTLNTYSLNFYLMQSLSFLSIFGIALYCGAELKKTLLISRLQE